MVNVKQKLAEHITAGSYKEEAMNPIIRPTTMYLWVKYTTASRVYIHLVAKAVRIESAMG